MRTRRWLLAVISGAALVLAPGAAQSATAPTAAVAKAATLTDGGPSGWDGDRRGSDGDRRGPDRRHPKPPPPPPPSQSFCKPGTPPNAPPTTQYFDNNPNLGPATLPTAQPVGPLLAGYQRFGGLTEQEWLADFQKNGQLVYPPEQGFETGPDGRPVKTAFELQPGYRIDRFGNPSGAFLSPVGTPYSSRAIPPLNLNTPADSPLANYRSYCVLKPFKVDAGPAAPWFAQPGGGTQYVLNNTYVPQAMGNLTVAWLVANDFLVQEDLATAAAAVPSQPSAAGAADTTGMPDYAGR